MRHRCCTSARAPELLYHGKHHAAYVKSLSIALAVFPDLQQNSGGRLEMITTSGHDNPLMQGHFPLLLNDVWEHAYYLKHENRRADYLHGWWPGVNWQEAEHRYARSEQFARA